MAIGDTPITVTGNIVADPELRFTPSGAAVCNFRIASTPRVWDSSQNGYTDGDPLFLTCNVWRQAAENTAESLTKGMRVIVNGRLRQRNFQTKNGDNRSVYEIEVDDIGPSLKFASAHVTRNPPQGHHGNTTAPGGPQPQNGIRGYHQPQDQGQGDPWNASPPASPADGDEPPF